MDDSGMRLSEPARHRRVLRRRFDSRQAASSRLVHGAGRRRSIGRCPVRFAGRRTEGLVGEPALGPPAFPHRVSALPNPLSPIAHHWLDATHITFGVVTAGVYDAKWKAEMSVFNGREPDERRYDFDFAALDSVAGRVWFLPTESLALQVSAGHLNEAEPGPAGTPPVNDGSVHDIGDISSAFWRQSFLGDDARLGGQPRVGRCNQRLDRGIERQPVGTARVVRSCRDERQTGPRSSYPRVERRFHRREAPGGLHSIL